VSHLNAFSKPDLPAASGTCVFIRDDTQVAKLVHFKIPVQVDIFQMQVLFVSACDKIFHPFYGMIGNNPGLEAYRPGKTHGSAGCLRH